MNPLRLRVRNYRTFESLDLDLPTGCVAIIGDNGAGKSSIVNAIDLALFGARSFEPYLTEGAEGVDLELELVFEHRADLYRVRRGFSARGRGKTILDLERATFAANPGIHDGGEPRTWEPLTREKTSATQEAIEELLGLSRDTFRASAFLAQGDGAAFTEADPKDRKRILADVLGLGVWAAMVELVRRDRREAEQQLERIGGLMEHADEELARIPDREREIKVCTDIAFAAATDLTAAEASLEAARVEFQKLNEQTTLRAQAIAKVDVAAAAFQAHEEKRLAAVAAQEQAVAVKAEISALAPAGAVDELEREEAALRERITAAELERERYLVRLNEARTAQSRRTDFLGTASGLNEKAHEQRTYAENLEQTDLPATCDRCSQALGGEARAAAIASLRADADKLDAEAARLAEQAEAIEVPEVGEEPKPDEEAAGALTAILAKLNVARAAQAQRATLEERLSALHRTVAVADNPAFLGEISRLHDLKQIAEGELRRLSEVDPATIARVQTTGLQAKATVEQERQRLEQANRDKAVAEAELARLRELEEKLANARRERAGLHDQVDLLADAERIYGRDGIPSYIVQNTALPAIELEATRILQELGTSYRVELRTEREKKTGGLADTLDVVLITEAGERPYETLSGGERTRLNLALRIALARLLSHRRGAESRLLAIDEPEFLDAAGTAALAIVLQGLSGDFDRVYLVSHVPDLAGAFDQVLTVVKDGDRSSVAA